MRRELTANELSGADIGATINVNHPSRGFIVGMLVDVHHRGNIISENALCDPDARVDIGRTESSIHVYDGIDLDVHRIDPRTTVVLITK